MKPSVITIPITKVDELRREVWGVMTSEAVDKVNERFDYESSKPHFVEWSETASKATGGKSLGNLRAMHGNVSAGKLIAFHPDDTTKSFSIGTKVVDNNEWEKVVEGVYTGFSIGGSYVKRWDDPDSPGVKRFTAKPSEVSLVDNPCNPDATFELIRSSGSTEMRKFAQTSRLSESDVKRIAKAVASSIPVTKSGKTKKVDGYELPPSAFLHVGDADKTDTWKLPIEFPDEEATKNHIRNALSRFTQTEGIPAAEKHTIAQRLISAAKTHGIEVKTFAEEHVKAQFPSALQKREGLGLQKSLWDVSSLADALQSMCYLQMWLASNADYNETDSTIHEDLHGALLTLKQIFIDLATEEINALIREKESAEKVVKAAPTSIGKGVTHVVTQIEKLKKNIESAKPEELGKYVGLLLKAADHIGKMSGHMEKAMQAHDKMAPHIDNLMTHCDKALKPLHEHVTAVHDHHVALGKELDKVGDSLEDVKAAAEAEDEAGLEAASQKSSGASELRKAKREFNEELMKIRAQSEEQILKLTEAFEKVLGGGADSPVAETVPVRTGIPVSKSADGTAVGGVDSPSRNKGAVKSEAGISATLPNGMPNPDYIKAVRETGGTDEFVKAAAKVKESRGNPFPSTES